MKVNFPANYYSRLARMAIRDPRKIPAMLRLKSFKSADARKDFSAGKVRVDPPLIVSLRLNYSCNLRCVMCNQWGESGIYVNHPEKMPPREISTEEWKRFIDHISHFSPYITFIGGEPLLNEDLPELIRHASSRHLITSLTTNGTFLKEKGEALIRSGLDYIHLSLDAPKSSEDNPIRIKPNREDSQEAAASAIKDFIGLRDRLKVGLPVVQLQTVIVEENHDKLLEMAEYAEALKPDIWSLQLCVHTTKALNEATTKTYQHYFNQSQIGWSGFVRGFGEMDFDLLDSSIRKIRKRKSSVKVRVYSPMNDPSFSSRQYFKEPFRFATKKKLRCMHPYVFAQVQPNGDLVFCGEQPDFKIGNIRDGAFLDAWSGQRATSWRNFLQRKLFPSCKRCYALHELNRFSPD